VFGALAYLTRPEGAFIIAATGLVLLGGQAVPAWRRRTRDFITCGLALCLTALVLTVPYMRCIGHVTAKPSGVRIVEKAALGGQEVGAPLFAVWDDPYTKQPSERVGWAYVAVGTQVAKGSFYVGWAAAFLGLWCYRRRFREQPGAWMLVLLSGAVLYAGWRVAVIVGYLSDRHTLLAQVSLIPWAVMGFATLGEWVLARFPSMPARLAWAVPLAFVVAGLPKSLEPLHEHRAGFRQAGLWLSEHTRPADVVNDPLCWAHFYAGRLFMEGTKPPRPKGYMAHEYVVIEKAGNDHNRVPTFAQAAAKAQKGERVYQWEGHRGRKKVLVEIYALPFESEAH
jgi:hypothetical protein